MAMTRRGRPWLPEEVAALVLELRKTGMGYGTIARKLGIRETSARRICKRTGHGKPRQNSPEGGVP